LPDKLPQPRPKKYGGLALTAVLALLLVGGAAFWLTRDDSERGALRGQAAATLDSLTQGTLLAGMGDILRGAPPLPPVGASQKGNAATPSGASGRVVQGSVAAPVDKTLPPEHSADQKPGPVVVVASSAPAAAKPVQPIAPKVTEDKTVRPDFVEDLAAYIVSRYKPGHNSGSLTLGVQGINQRYGAKMTGFSTEGRPAGNRAGVLRYVFSPAMIQALYGLYVDRFLQALKRCSEEKSFTPEQTRQLFMAVSGRSVLLAGGLEGVANLPDLSGRLKKLDRAAQDAVNVNAEMMQVVFELDQLREDKAPQSSIEAAQSRVNALSARYRATLNEREAAQRVLLADIRKGGGQSLDDDTLLFLAHWVERRLHDTTQSLAAAGSAAGVLRDLARRCAQEGTSATAANGRP
jgi:outer membrane murein-binding lipoprotein Lpp